MLGLLDSSVEHVAYNEEVRNLLTSCDLPVSDLHPGGNVNFFGIRYDGELLGVVGIEVCGEVGVLRSLAVSSAHQGKCHGRRLVAGAETWAARRGLKALYLLTMTAAEFFERPGYVELSRSEAPRHHRDHAVFGAVSFVIGLHGQGSR